MKVTPLSPLFAAVVQRSVTWPPHEHEFEPRWFYCTVCGQSMEAVERCHLGGKERVQ